MDVYLMQHGVAMPAEEDPARPLSASGHAEVERVARRAATSGIAIGRCIHSGKLRAEQTARVLGEAVGAVIEGREGLSPSDPVGPLVDWLRRAAEPASPPSIAIVGHLPFLDRLAGVLVAGDENARPVRFRNAGLVKLVPKAEGSGYAVEWILTPELAV